MMKSFIADALLLMQKKNFAEITIGEIVEKAGINRSTYYRHFNKKEDVIVYFLDNISKKILEWNNTQKPDFKAHIINVYNHYYKHKTQMLTIYKNGLSILFLDILKKYLRIETEQIKKTSEQYDIAFHIGGTFNHFMLWFSREMADSPETMAQYTLAVLPYNYIYNIRERNKHVIIENN